MSMQLNASLRLDVFFKPKMKCKSHFFLDLIITVTFIVIINLIFHIFSLSYGGGGGKQNITEYEKGRIYNIQ